MCIKVSVLEHFCNRAKNKRKKGKTNMETGEAVIFILPSENAMAK